MIYYSPGPYLVKQWRWFKGWRAGCRSPKFHPVMCPCVSKEIRYRK
jgi:hypothetical protein